MFVLFAVLIAAVLLAYRNHQETAREDALKQVFAALQQYAEVSAGNYYPLRSAQEGVFLPDFDEWEKLASDKASFERAREILTRTDGRPLCYLGYAFNKETFGLKILDRIESDAKSFRGGGPVEGFDWVYLGSPEVDELHALRKGVERTIVWDFLYDGTYPSEVELGDRIPVLWEMPQGEQDEVLVLNLNGYAWKHKYPDEFPLSSLFVNRLRGLMRLPQDPGFREDAPIIPVLREILSVWDHLQTEFPSPTSSFDIEPSVAVGEQKGYRVVVPAANLVLFPDSGTKPRFDVASYFRGETEKAELWRHPDTGQYVGSGNGYHWYGSVTYQMQVLLRKRFQLTGGEGLYASAALQSARRSRVRWWPYVSNTTLSELEAELEQPESLEDYVELYIATRSKQERPISREIMEAGALLNRHLWRHDSATDIFPDKRIRDTAKTRLRNGSHLDPEGAATVAMLFVISTMPFTGPRIEADGVRLLRELQWDEVARVVEDMASRIQDPKEADACRRVLDELSRSPAVDAPESTSDVDG
jgi:hypothetical protein